MNRQIKQVKQALLGPVADWATVEHQDHKDLPIKSRAAIHIVWRAAAALNAKFMLRNDDDSDASIASDAIVELQQDLARAAIEQPTDDDPSQGAQRPAGVRSATVSIAPARTADQHAVANRFGKGSVAAPSQSSVDDATSRRSRVVAAGAPKSAREVRPDLLPKLVRPESSSTPSPAASGGGGAALATTLFAAIAVCCLIGIVLRYIEEPASSTSTNAVPYEGDGRAAHRSHATQPGDASESTQDRKRR